MHSIKPKTYNELMRYTRCLRLKGMVKDMDDALFAKIYRFITESSSHAVALVGDALMFYVGADEVETVAVQTIGTFNSATLTYAALNIAWPTTHTSSGSDGGVGGNSNNNNNNNNNNS